jgi:Na+/glutamate symporter
MSLGQIGFGLGAVGLAALLMIPVREEARRALCFLWCPPSQDDAFTVIFAGYLFLSLVLVPGGLLLLFVGIIRWALHWSASHR